jgi:hypothetical protein
VSERRSGKRFSADSPGARVDYRNRQGQSGLLKFMPYMETGPARSRTCRGKRACTESWDCSEIFYLGNSRRID